MGTMELNQREPQDRHSTRSAAFSGLLAASKPRVARKLEPAFRMLQLAYAQRRTLHSH